MRLNYKFQFWLDLKKAIFYNKKNSQITKLLKNYNFTSQIIQNMKKIALGLSIFFLIWITFHNSFQWACQHFVTKLTLMGLNCSQDQTPYLNDCIWLSDPGVSYIPWMVQQACVYSLPSEGFSFHHIISNIHSLVVTGNYPITFSIFKYEGWLSHKGPSC